MSNTEEPWWMTDDEEMSDEEYEEEYEKTGGYTWYCDGCGTVMNNQDGFTVERGWWKCEKCGLDNDVSEDNIR